MTDALSWRAALDEWEAFLDELQDALDRDEWTGEDWAEWSPPAALAAPPTEQEQARLLALTERARVLRERVDDAMRDTAAGLHEERRRVAGATAYERQQRRG